MSTESNGNGNVVEIGSLRKLLLSFPSQWVSTLYLQRLDQQDVLSWQWVDYHERIVVQVYMAHQAGSLPT